MKLKLVIPGKPIGQGRPRFSRRGKRVRAYDPPTSKKYKALVTQIAQQAYTGEPTTEPVVVDIKAWYAVPSSYSKKRKQAIADGEELKVTKPDVDNVGKGILDALTGVIWLDDNQVISLTVTKGYAPDGVGRAEVTIQTLDE